MRIEIDAIEQSTCDTRGNLAVIGLRTRTADKHMLVLTFTTAEQLIAHLASAGQRAQQAKGSDGTPQDGKEPGFLAQCTHVAVGIGPSGGARLFLRFGEMRLSADLDASTARSLSQQLLRATAQGPTTAQ